MESINCSGLAANLSLSWSEACVLAGAFPGESRTVKVSAIRWLASSLYDLSGSEVKLPGAPVALYFGDVAGLIECGVAFVGWQALMVACGLLGYSVKRSSRLPRAAKAAVFGAVGLAMPLLPLALLAALGPPRTALTRFNLGMFPCIGLFRWLELALGTGPRGLGRTARGCMLYLGVPAEVLFGDDGRALAAADGRWRQELLSLLGHVAPLLLVLAVGGLSQFTPFLGSGADLLALPAAALPRALPAVWLQAALVYLLMTTVLLAASLACALLGVETHAFMRQPLLLSTSVRDFWSRRWNLLVHRLMHRGFFKPLAVRAGPRVGAGAAFLASAIFHEYGWALLNWETQGYRGGKVGAFFFMQFVLVTAEAALKRTRLSGSVSGLPAPVQTFLTTLVILPFGPLFLADLQRGGLIAGVLRLYPHLRLVV